MVVFLAGAVSLCLGVAIGMAIKPLAKKIGSAWRPRRMSVCPICSTPVDQFEPVVTSEVDTEPNLAVRCGHVISDPFKECGFAIPRALLDVPWLRIHGVGGTCSSGQTMWNAACFGRISPFFSANNVGIETLESQGGEECVRNWVDMYQVKVQPAATHVNQPYPWLMLAKQAQGRHSSMVVAVSDFAGEIARNCAASEGLYKHLLDADCHVFFVDPEADKKSQLGVFHRFLVRLRERRGASGQWQADWPDCCLHRQMRRASHDARKRPRSSSEVHLARARLRSER